jgi:cell division septation protein DedD
MRGVFDEEELRPAQQAHDRELTLGSGTLLVIFFGLVLICGVCFGLGYAVGRRGLQDPAGPQAADATQASAQTSPSKAKPSAVTTNPAQTTSTDATDAAAIAEADGSLVSQTAGGAGVGLSAGQAAVPAGVAAIATPASQAVVGASAIKPAGSLMVQIAAVTDADDANVLMGALRKRGYAVSGQRDAGDGMIHVRIGPFASKDEADKWRMKLLNDGYNAILQP